MGVDYEAETRVLEKPHRVKPALSRWNRVKAWLGSGFYFIAVAGGIAGLVACVLLFLGNVKTARVTFYNATGSRLREVTVTYRDFSGEVRMRYEGLQGGQEVRFAFQPTTDGHFHVCVTPDAGKPVESDCGYFSTSMGGTHVMTYRNDAVEYTELKPWPFHRFQ